MKTKNSSLVLKSLTLAISGAMAITLATSFIAANAQTKQAPQSQNAQGNAPGDMRGNMRGMKDTRGPKQIKSIEDANKKSEQMTEAYTARMNNVKTKLKLTSDQVSLWENYVNAGKAMIPSGEQMFAGSQIRAQGNTPEVQKVMLAHRQHKMNAKQNQTEAYQALFDSASAEQKEILKKETHLMPMGMHGGSKHGAKGGNARRNE